MHFPRAPFPTVAGGGGWEEVVSSPVLHMLVLHISRPAHVVTTVYSTVNRAGPGAAEGPESATDSLSTLGSPVLSRPIQVTTSVLLAPGLLQESRLTARAFANRKKVTAGVTA